MTRRWPPKGYTYAMWVLEWVGGFPKDQRIILGKRLANYLMDMLETTYAKDKTVLRVNAGGVIVMTRWIIRMKHDLMLLTPNRSSSAMWKLLDRRSAVCFLGDVIRHLPVKHSPVSPLGLALAAGIVLTTPAFAVVNIDYASIGNAGNAADPATGSIYGAVAYDYQIAKNETTISQYAEFLNAVAKTNSYGLYSATMTTSYINGISQGGVSGSFTYSVTSGSGNKPISNVSWFDAARFCNWLHNGQQTGVDAALTAETGAYTLNGATSGIISKNVGATVWIPSESEWYKAAYYDPTKDGTGGYWLHANQSDTIPSNDIGVAGAANYIDANGYAVYTGSGAGTWVLTDVGAYGENSVSSYGTNDQAGNVFEWNDAVISGASRGLRGGSWDSNGSNLSSLFRGEFDPTFESTSVGFRVAGVPEPTSLVLTLLAGSGMLARRKR